MQSIEGRHTVVLRMFNEREGSWKVTTDRLDALTSPPTGMDPRHASTISDMVDSALDGGKTWGLTAERYGAIHNYLAMAQAPAPEAIKGVVQRMKVGGIRDGVSDREWFIDAMKELVELMDRK